MRSPRNDLTMILSFRQSMAHLHTWTSLLAGWILFAMFLFGTTAFFQQEISRWMRPELSGGTVTVGALNAASDFLRHHAPDAESWSLSLPSSRGGDPLSISWQPRGGGSGKATLDPTTGREIVIRDSSGGGFLYRMHFDLHYMPVMWARYLVCIAALAMLVAILSGIVTHKKIFADFFLIRIGKGQRSWLDAHNVSAVLALPFHLMMTYTGLVTLLFMLMPWAISANFPTSETFYEAAFPPGPKVEASGTAASLLSLPTILTNANAALGGNDPGYIIVNNPGDAHAVVEVWPIYNQLPSPRGGIFMNAVNGKVIKAPSARVEASAVQDISVDLHRALFAAPLLRWLYFLSGVGGTMMVGSGLVLWTVKRRAKLPDPARPHFGFRLVERLNIGVIVGATIGIAVYFLANRLLPIGMANRADWEINSLFIAWGGLFAWSIGRPAKRAWIEALAACAALYALVPVVNALTTARGLIPSLVAGDWVFVGFDLVTLAMATVCVFAAWKVATHTPKPAL